MRTSIQEMQSVLRAQCGDREALERLLASVQPSLRLLAHFALLLIWMALLTLVVVIQMTAMTKRILRAIELASRK